MTDTTRDRTIQRGRPADGGWSSLTLGDGEPPDVEPPRGTTLAAVWHLSDLHVCDVESPARLVHLDRYGDPDSPVREALGHIGAYRPQEILTVHVAVSMVETMNRRPEGPVTGRRIDAVLVTGDLVDNAQENELRWLESVVHGGPITPKSGAADRSSWVGSRDGHPWDVRYWHPDGPPKGEPADLPMLEYGYPRLPGLVECAHGTVNSPGLDFPVLAVHGNHDALAQGTVPADASLAALATGDAFVTGLAPDQSPMEIAKAIAESGPASYIHRPSSPRWPIGADPNRAFLRPGTFAERLALPRTTTSNTWATDCGELRVIALDTVNPHGGWQGSISVDQLDWLVGELQRSAQRPVVIATHHPSPTLTNDYAPIGSPRRVLGPELEDVLVGAPQVIAWMAGHIHAHAALWHGRPTPAGADPDRGFWEFTTGSLVDWPQQARIVEFVRAEGRIWIASTVVDHDAPVQAETAQWSADATHRDLASWSRVLAANDYRMREVSLRRMLVDSHPTLRNTVWSLADPFAGR